MSVADRTFLVRDQPYYIVRSHYLVCDSSFASPCVAEIIAVTAFFISGLRFLQSEMSLRSSSEKSFVRRLSQKNSATEIPKAAQQLSIVETVGLLPRFRSWIETRLLLLRADILTTRVHREARKYGLSNPYHSPPRYTIILYQNYAAALERIGYIVLPCICVLFGIKCNEVVLSFGRNRNDCSIFLHFPAKYKTDVQVLKYLCGGSSSETGCYISFTTLVKTR